MSTFIVATDIGGTGARVAIKDLIDVAGLPTTAGCRAKENVAVPAGSDAACLAEIRRQVTAGGLRLVGKTNLHELAFGTTGRNPWFGTPRNPLDADRIPGGSSSGSAVAVASGDADIGLGSDTGGSVRIPAACCGVVGLKTTTGRVSTAGTWPLAPTLDTIGPIGRTVDSVIDGMRLLEPGFEPAPVDVDELRLLRLAVPAHPDVDRAVDAVLETLGLPVTHVVLRGWERAARDASTILSVEAWRANRRLLHLDPSGVSAPVTARLHAGSTVGADDERAAREGMAVWRQALAQGHAERSLSSRRIDAAVAAGQRTHLGYLDTGRRIDVRPDSVQVLGETLPHCGCPPVSLVWLSHGLRSRRAPREERLERGLFCSK